MDESQRTLLLLIQQSVLLLNKGGVCVRLTHLILVIISIWPDSNMHIGEYRKEFALWIQEDVSLEIPGVGQFLVRPITIALYEENH